VEIVSAEYRRALGIEAWMNDDVVIAALGPNVPIVRVHRGKLVKEAPPNRTAEETARLAVVRMCIYFLEASPDACEAWLDKIQLALADADPARIAGILQAEARHAGNQKSADARNRMKRHAATVKKIRAMIARGEEPVAKKLTGRGRSLTTVYRLIDDVKAESAGS